MDSKPLLQSLTLRNFLSYGPNALKVELAPLNVLIGQNASGKSNFIQAIEFLRAMPRNIAAQAIQGGGVEEYLYKGTPLSANAEITAEVNDTKNQDLVSHTLSFAALQSRLYITNESIDKLVSLDDSDDLQDFPIPYFEYRGNTARIIQDTGEWNVIQKFQTDLSILAQRTDPDLYPTLAYLAEKYQAIKIYRNFNLEGLNSLRSPQRPDLPNDFLEEDGRNLSLILNDLQFHGSMRAIIEKMQAVYSDIEDINVKVGGGTVQIFFRERGLTSQIPASRLSDGTLRYLCLLAILYHHNPPPLICIEEPELGMHPDVIPTIADMLMDASQRTQLVVTTHSDMLVTALGNTPESIIICERNENGSQLHRLEPEPLQKWLEDYSLGELWRTGEIGGVRY